MRLDLDADALFFARYSYRRGFVGLTANPTRAHPVAMLLEAIGAPEAKAADCAERAIYFADQAARDLSAPAHASPAAVRSRALAADKALDKAESLLGRSDDDGSLLNATVRMTAIIEDKGRKDYGLAMVGDGPQAEIIELLNAVRRLRQILQHTAGAHHLRPGERGDEIRSRLAGDLAGLFMEATGKRPSLTSNPDDGSKSGNFHAFATAVAESAKAKATDLKFSLASDHFLAAAIEAMKPE